MKRSLWRERNKWKMIDNSIENKELSERAKIHVIKCFKCKFQVCGNAILC